VIDRDDLFFVRVRRTFGNRLDVTAVS